MKKEVIIIISPDASRTGAPILLLRYLDWVKNNTNLSFIIILRQGGELFNQFEKVGKVYIWNDEVDINKKDFYYRILFKIIGKFKSSYSFFISRFLKYLKNEYDVKNIIANTAVNGNIFKLIKNSFNCKTFTFVHEGNRLLKSFDKETLVKSNLETSDEIIIVSEFIKNSLKKNYTINQPIHLLNGSIDCKTKSAVSVDVIKRNNNIPQDKIIIMCCGYLTWHKGTDVFIQLIIQLSKINDSVHFVWLGGNADQIAYQQLQFDLEMLHLTSKVSFIFSVNNSLDYINSTDILLVISREESFSLVTIEAGLLKKPVLFFEGSGGPCEIVNNDKRFIIPYIDVQSLVNRTQELCISLIQRKEMGEFLHKIVVEKYDTSVQAKKFLSIIEPSSTI